MPTTTCDNCGALFQRNRFELNKTKRHFCSPKCYGEHLSKANVGKAHPNYHKVDCVCRQCAKSFTLPRSWVTKGDGTFCSRACKAAWQKEHPTGSRPPVMRGADNPRWKGGYEGYYGPNWRTQRNAARKRDRYTCRRCGAKENGREHDVHHLKRFGDFGIERYQEANDLSNLITLCHPCHLELEHEQELRPNPPAR